MTIKGQILETCFFALEIRRVLEEHKPKTIVEIGTWRGLGSTKRIIEAIQEIPLECDFISLESNSFFHLEAQHNLKDCLGHVSLIYGRIVPYDKVLERAKNIALTEEQKRWLYEDIHHYLACPDVLASLPVTIDFLLLDGGEFSTILEWELLKDRTKIVALDDTKELKCREIKSTLEKDNNYELLSSSEERNGFAIFKRKD